MGSSTTFTCDSCGAKGRGVPGEYDYHDPPHGWVWRWGSVFSGPHACSERCWVPLRMADNGKIILPDSHERRAKHDAEAKEAHAQRMLRPAPERAAVAVKPKTAARVYFIQQGDSGPVKIGTSRNVLGRLKQLQTSAAEPLRVLAEVPGGPEEEARLHARFATARLSGEWFQPTEDLTVFAALAKARGSL